MKHQTLDHYKQLVPFFKQSQKKLFHTIAFPQATFRSNHSEVFLGIGVLKICSKLTGEHPCRSVISIKMQSNFIEVALRHGCSPVILLHIFRTPFVKNTSGWLLLHIVVLILWEYWKNTNLVFSFQFLLPFCVKESHLPSLNKMGTKIIWKRF